MSNLILSKEEALKVLISMKGFEKDLSRLYSKWNYPINENIGRKNIFLSLSQEQELCKILKEKYKGVVADGAPGKPDILIGEIETEIECKLTSGSKQKSGSVNYSLQTDWDTICNKKMVDYIFILANYSFDKFAFLYFKNLSSEDFFPPSTGSRGKARMNKSKAMKKCTPLFGSFVSRKVIYLKNTREKIIIANEKYAERIAELEKRKASTKKQKDNLRKLYENAKTRYDKKLNKLNLEIERLNKSKDSYSFILEEVE